MNKPKGPLIPSTIKVITTKKEREEEGYAVYKTCYERPHRPTSTLYY